MKTWLLKLNGSDKDGQLNSRRTAQVLDSIAFILPPSSLLLIGVYFAALYSETGGRLLFSEVH
jgi:hypothetical protein